MLTVNDEIGVDVIPLLEGIVDLLSELMFGLYIGRNDLFIPGFPREFTEE